jgi:gliding motility-associated-like protein
MPAGNFNLNINNGTDGNTVADSCFSFMTAPTLFPFTTTQAPAPVYDTLQYDRCSPNSIRVFYSNPILCSSINSNGSEFLITGPVAVTITGVTIDATCAAGGYTNSVLLILSQPINTFGTYVLHNIAGADGNSVTDTCYSPQNTSETISLDVLGRPSAVFEDSVHFGCTVDTLVVSHAGGNGINSWQWTFSDGTVVNGPTASHSFPATTLSATVQLIVSNGICSDTITRTYTLNNAFAAGCSISADSICRNGNLSFSNTSTGNNLTYNWNFGDGNTFIGQSPPPHNYTNPGNYSITLTVNNNMGCIDDSIKIVTVTDTPVVRFMGLNNQYCTRDVVNLSTNIIGDNVVSYTWNNGNGNINSNQPTVNYTYNNEGLYDITLTATDRYCGNYSYTESTQIYKVPTFNLGADITLCPGMQTTIGVSPVNGYTYLWSNGATASQILSALTSSSYSLMIDNNGCTSTDGMTVTVMDHCLIKVPGAFTPNNDGLNDRLKAINADLAKEFSMQVYNRFGQLVFSTSVPTDGWDGTFKGVAATAGTYVWQLRYIDPTSGKKVYEKGTSILIR